jgi:hypothetical protein
VLTATIQDQLGVAIPGATLTTCVYTLYAENTVAGVALPIVNTRTDVNCKPDVSAGGVLTLILTPDDMAILDDALEEERHRLLIEWTYDSGKEGRHEAQIIVSNVAKVP